MPLAQACPEGSSAPASGGVMRTARTVSMPVAIKWRSTRLATPLDGEVNTFPHFLVTEDSPLDLKEQSAVLLNSIMGVD
jgi:hypothetical protein